ncbi:glycosyltransferase [Deinococcus sp. Arct2-2]|uniref:glycosyltransferase family 4 protein n=1 Tax=Deinococcus sp. Arct2-2 TaxID=2568653 RepID=UPI001454DC20|nr:glycosyltransferase [Deinococcus sp. Arct2-2]
MKLLMSAYACAPDKGSEAGIGWSWVNGMADLGHDVTVLTHTRNRSEIETAPVRPNLRFEYVSPSTLSGKVKGQLGVFAQYFSWQAEALATARKSGLFDVVHHVTWGSLQGGSHLWKLGYPFVFGPVGGGQTMPPTFYTIVQGDLRLERLRTAVTRLMPWFPPARATFRRANLVLAANTETGELAKRMGAQHIEYMADTAMQPHLLHPPEARQSKELFEVLWVGRLLHRKAVLLAIDVMERLDDGFRLTIYGDGPDGPALAHRIQHSLARHRIDWKGQVPWGEVMVAYRSSDAFLFTSARDTMGSQVFEAMGSGLPVVTMNHQGVGTHVPDAAGIKVPVTNPGQVAHDLAQALKVLRDDSERWQAAAQSAFDSVQSHLPEKRLEQMDRLYRGLRVKS